MTRNRKLIEKSMECTVCKGILNIFRLNGRNRIDGHIKTMWCPTCKDYRQFIELNMYYQYIDRELDILEKGYARFIPLSSKEIYYGVEYFDIIYYEHIKDQSNFYYKLEKKNGEIPLYCSSEIFKKKFKKVK